MSTDQILDTLWTEFIKTGKLKKLEDVYEPEDDADIYTKADAIAGQVQDSFSWLTRDNTSELDMRMPWASDELKKLISGLSKQQAQQLYDDIFDCAVEAII
jgi:hypothetical protein